MKTKSILAAALALGMLAACQKEAPVGTQDDGATASTNAYVSVSINLPSTTSTRANDNYDDGEASEYKVNDVLIILYDNSGNYVSENAETPAPWLSDNSENITVTAKTKAIKTSNNATQVLVLLNANGVIPTGYKNMTFEQLNTAIEVSTALTSGKMFMSNAPYFVNGAAQYLVPVTPQSSETLALENSVDVNVERAAVKVEVNYEEEITVKNTNNNKTLASAKIEGWNVDNTSKKFYPVRNVLADWATIEYPDIIGKDNRIYYAVDPHYDAAVVEGDLSKNEDFPYTNAQNDNIAYCLENTFDINNQTENNTTRIILKVKYTPESLAEGTWFQYGTGKNTVNADGLLTVVETALKEKNYIETLSEDEKINIKDIIDGLPAGTVKDDVMAYNTYTFKDLVGEVVCYKEGYCYYRVLLRHFNAHENGYGTDKELTAAEKDFMTEFEMRENKTTPYIAKDLGRYGVVRNNWYVVNIEGISGPGSPTIPDTPNVPDDAVDKYVACNINILAWCKRNQSVIL